MTVVVAEVVDGPAEDDDNDQVPITVGAAAHPLRPTSRSGRLRRRLTEIVVDPEVERYAPRPPRRHRLRRFLAILVVLVLLAGGALYLGYRWTQNQYYIGESGGYVAVYQGEPSSVFGFKLHHVVFPTKLAVAALNDEGQANVQNNTMVFDSKADAVSKLSALNQIAAECKAAAATPTPKPSTKPSHRTTPPKQRIAHPTGTHRTTPSTTSRATSSPTPPPGCPTP